MKRLETNQKQTPSDFHHFKRPIHDISIGLSAGKMVEHISY